MIRPTVPGDTPELLAIARETGVFKPAEIVALEEVLDDYHAQNVGLGHRSVTLELDGRPIGFAYYAAAAMTDRTWYLYWIAVSRTTQARGLGSRLLHWAEREIAERNGRLLLIETSGLPHYELTRRFYAKHGYHVACRISDYYADGDDMVVFGKRFLPVSVPPYP
jgi:ribosomal protein S18 acetylase RimI-like enzyme